MARVLVVDDDPAALEIRKLILERAGHKVSTAASAAEARLHKAEVVLLDLRLPEIEDGLALLREFHGKGARVIVLCGNRADLDGHPEAALADAVLSKPARSDAVLKAIEAR